MTSVTISRREIKGFRFTLLNQEVSHPFYWDADKKKKVHSAAVWDTGWVWPQSDETGRFMCGQFWTQRNVPSRKEEQICIHYKRNAFTLRLCVAAVRAQTGKQLFPKMSQLIILPSEFIDALNCRSPYGSDGGSVSSCGCTSNPWI